MKIRIIALQLAIAWCLIGSIFVHSDCSASFFIEAVEKETEKIQQILPDDLISLSDAYASRGESYLLMHCFEEALNDFHMAYTCAFTSDEDEGHLCGLRALIGTFFAYAMLDDVKNTRAVFNTISSLMTACPCCEQQPISVPNFSIRQCTYRNEPEPNYPILGSDRISRQECAERVESVTKELQLLCAAIPNTQARALAIILIDRLETEAKRCCWAGGLWKGCLQKLVNKLHYWHRLGAPSDLSYYTGVNFM